MSTKIAKTYPLNIKVDLPEEFLFDTMVTMVESAFGSWFWFSDVIRLHEPENSARDLSITSFNVQGDDPDEDEGVPMKTVKKITPDLVVQAIADLLSGKVRLGYPLGRIQRAVRDADAGDIDSVAADAILQTIVYGEIIYG